MRNYARSAANTTRRKLGHIYNINLISKAKWEKSPFFPIENRDRHMARIFFSHRSHAQQIGSARAVARYLCGCVCAPLV